MTTHTKQNAAAGATAFQETHSHTSPAIIAAERPDCKTYQTAQAALALKGFTLNRSYRIDDGRVTYLVANWLSTRSFTHWHDVGSLIASLSSGEGVNHA